MWPAYRDYLCFNTTLSDLYIIMRQVSLYCIKPESLWSLSRHFCTAQGLLLLGSNEYVTKHSVPNLWGGRTICTPINIAKCWNMTFKLAVSSELPPLAAKRVMRMGVTLPVITSLVFTTEWMVAFSFTTSPDRLPKNYRYILFGCYEWMHTHCKVK